MAVPSILEKALRTWKSDKSYFILILGFGVFPTLFSSSLLVFFYETLKQMATNESAVILFYAATVFSMAFALTPTTFIAVLSGYFFGFAGLAGIMIAYPLAAVTGLWFGKYVNRLFTGRDYFDNPALKLFIDKLSERQFFLFFFCRLSPFLPFAMTNVALSRMNIHFWKYIGGTMTGMFPRTFLFFLAGMQTQDVVAFLKHPDSSGMQSLLIPLFILVSLVGFYFLLRNVIQKMRLEISSEHEDKL